MKTTTAFRTLSEIRRDKNRAAARFIAISTKKDGSPRKVMPSDRDNGCATREEAEAKISYLESINPGIRFVVVEA